MNLKNLLFSLAAAAVLVLTGCSSEDDTAGSNFDWTISAENAPRILDQAASLQSYDFGNSISADPSSTLKALETKALTNAGSETCPGGGSVTVQIETDDLTQELTGFVMSLSNCDMNDGLGATSGTVSLGFDTNLGGDTLFTMSLNITSSKETINGDIVLAFYSNSTVGISYDMSVTTSAGTVSIVTNSEFLYTFGAMYPYEGQMTITGVDNAKLRITALDTEVLVEVDEDADGVYEITIQKLWSAF